MAGLFLEDLTVGQSAEAKRTVTADDIDRFAAVSGDNNPVHVDDAYAAKTPFKTRIAHGMLAGAFISAVLGERLPGPGAIYDIAVASSAARSTSATKSQPAWKSPPSTRVTVM